ncbi:MAG TPA: hypothetical protein VKR31_14480 [Rhizomicrobium sp.]|nr:hypothetical protein [Rhizomicrobium sp.]
MHVKLVAGVSYAAMLLGAICASALVGTSAMADNAGAAPNPGAMSGDQGQSSASACVTVAGAKSAQWDQKRLMIRETETFADGRKRVVEAIFTPDVDYARVDGGPWTSMNLVKRQRGVPPAGDLVKRMGLEDCGLSGSDGSGNTKESVYSYGYLPDARAGQVTGKMWVDDSSQLPVRQELAQTEAAQRNVPISIEASYTYGDAVTVPSDAVRSDERRRWLEQQVFFRNVGAASGAAGPSDAEYSFGGKHH